MDLRGLVGGCSMGADHLLPGIDALRVAGGWASGCWFSIGTKTWVCLVYHTWSCFYFREFGMWGGFFLPGHGSILIWAGRD